MKVTVSRPFGGVGTLLSSPPYLILIFVLSSPSLLSLALPLSSPLSSPPPPFSDISFQNSSFRVIRTLLSKGSEGHDGSLMNNTTNAMMYLMKGGGARTCCRVWEILVLRGQVVVVNLYVAIPAAQGYLAHKKPPPPRTLQSDYVYGPMVVGGSICRTGVTRS